MPELCTICLSAPSQPCRRPSEAAFLGLTFRTPDESVFAHLRAHPQALTGYTPSMLTIWDCSHHHRTAWLGETLLATADLSDLAGPPGLALLQPIGPFGADARASLLRALAAANRPVVIHGVSQEFLNAHPEFVAHFSVREERDSANCLYDAHTLAELSGRSLQKKRNLAHQFEKAYRWTVSPLTPELRTQCARLAIRQLGETLDQGFLPWETLALTRSLAEFEQLGLRGTAILVDDAVCAFSIWEGQTPAIAAVHFEKADRNFRGSHQVIARETARQVVAAGFAEINREEDMGLEGLRAAKLSYHPAHLEMSYRLEWVPRV